MNNGNNLEELKKSHRALWEELEKMGKGIREQMFLFLIQTVNVNNTDDLRKALQKLYDFKSVKSLSRKEQTRKNISVNLSAAIVEHKVEYQPNVKSTESKTKNVSDLIELKKKLKENLAKTPGPTTSLATLPEVTGESGTRNGNTRPQEERKIAEQDLQPGEGVFRIGDDVYYYREAQDRPAPQIEIPLETPRLPEQTHREMLKQHPVPSSNTNSSEEEETKEDKT